jgi:NADH-quinone oxidoreductase subunit M
VGMIYERTHSRQIADNIGLTKPMPRYATFLVIFALSSLGLPGTNSFVGEFLVLVGTFLWSKIAAALASLGIILAAAYLLWMIQRVAFGVPAAHLLPKLHDCSPREMATLVPLVVLIFWIGLFPNPILSRMHTSVEKVIARVMPASQEETAASHRQNSLSARPALSANLEGTSDREAPLPPHFATIPTKEQQP